MNCPFSLCKQIFSSWSKKSHKYKDLNMEKKKHRRVNFRIMQCSSQDPNYPVSQLLLQSPNAKGWQTKRFCQYPQIIVYQLVQPIILKQISILSHQSKISTKILIHCKLDNTKQWSKLGILSLQSNANSNFQARQLKTVNIQDKPSLYLRFSFDINYVNSHNIFNQVGVISLCVFGDRIGGADESDHLSMLITSQLQKNTLTRIKSLQLKKKQAIQQQDYDRAQQLKNEIQRLKNLGKTLQFLQQRKKKAIDNENYEDAKIINQKIKKLRDLQSGGLNLQIKPQNYRNLHHLQDKQPSISPQTFIIKRNQDKSFIHDDRPLNARNAYQIHEIDRVVTSEQIGQLALLSPEIREQCHRYFPVFNQQIFCHLFSTNHNYRQRGLNLVKDQLSRVSKSDSEISQAFLYIVKKLIDDKNMSVLLSTLDLFSIGMRKLKPPTGTPYSLFADEILQKMNQYLGHPTQKVKKTTEDIYYNLPVYQLTNKQICYDSLTKISKRQKPPKMLTGRIKMLTQLVISYQLGKNYQGTIRYAIKYADDKNSEVRNAAIDLICAIAQQIGYTNMQPFIKTLRPQLIKSIQQKFSQTSQHPYQQQLPKNKIQQIPITNKRQQFQQLQNQFIQVPHPKNIVNPQYICDFCQRFDKKFENQDYRDLHLYNACPMIIICQQCGQAVQISTFTSHQMSQCKNSKYYKKCQRCKQAINQSQYKVHVQKKQCIPCKPLTIANRCPLCHLDIDPGKQGWKNHLVQIGCQNNSRK